MDKNFISLFRAIPLWPNDLVPIDEIFKRLVAKLGIDTTSIDPVLFLAGVLGFRNIKLHSFDGVTTVTGELVLATELVFSPGQNYLGIVLGDPAGGLTSFPFALRIRDEPPIKNNDEVFQIVDNAMDPQLAAFTPVEKNPATGFVDVASWRLSLRNIPAKLRIIRGVTRVEPIDPANPTRGFRDLPDQFVDAGINISLDFDADGNLELWPPDPTLAGAVGDPVGALDLDLGWFRISGSPVVIAASGLTYHRANTRFPDDFEPAEGLDDSWSGFVAKEIGGFWGREPKEPEDELHIYGLVCKNLMVGKDVISFRASFEHGGGPNDPFMSTVPIDPADLPESRWSIRRIELWVTDGVGDFLQFGAKLTVAAIIDIFDYLPVNFEASAGRIMKQIEGFPEPMPFVELQGGLAAVQNHIQPTPDGKLRVPLFDQDVMPGSCTLNLEVNGFRFALLFPGGSLPGIDIPTVVRLQMDLNVEIGKDPYFEIEIPGFGFEYTSRIGRFKPLAEGLWFDTTLELVPLKIRGFEFSISRVGFGFESGTRDAYWVGFDANINFPGALGRGQVYGMKLGWDSDGAVFHIDGVGISIKKPAIELEGVVKYLDGSSSFVPEGEEPITIQPGSLAGDVRLAFPALDDPFSFEVGFMYGKYVRDAAPDEEHRFWMVLADLVFAGGLPLGFADLAFYGAAIAVGNNVAPRKTATTPWFDWYSKELPTYSVVAPTKWTAAHDRFVFAAGLVLGSSVKSGYPHNERLLGLYNSASESQGAIWLFDGKIRFLKEVTAPGDPQIAILLVIAPDQILFRADFRFSFPAEDEDDPGLVMTARGMIEVVNDRTGAGHHHVYFGRNEPYSERINAEILLGFFTAHSFYMLDWADLTLRGATLAPLAMAFGFAQVWKWDAKCGPLRLYAELNVELEVGFSKSAFYGFLRAYGGIGLKLWGFGFGLAFDGALLFFVSDGWELHGTFRVKLNLPWPVPDYKKEVKRDWGPGANPPVPVGSVLQQMSLSSPSIDGDGPVHEWSPDNVLLVPEAFAAERSLLPVDGSLLLTFRAPASQKVVWIVGTDVQPVDGSGEWKFRYTVEDVILRRRVPGGATFEPLPDELKYGFWEINSTAPATSSAPTTDGAPLSQLLRIWGDTPGQQLRNLGNLERTGSITWLDGYLDLFATWPCGPDVVMEPTCVHYDLTSFRLFDGPNTRVTILPGGLAIRSRSLLNPDLVSPESGFMVVLDEVVNNPRPDLWNQHSHTLALPYLYAANRERKNDFSPILSGIDIDVPASRDAVITLIGVFPEEVFLVQGFHADTVVSSATESGAGLHVLTVAAQDPHQWINRVRIASFNRGGGSVAPDPAAVSALASLCYRTREQLELHDSLVDQRQHLDPLIEILDTPPGLPGDNAAHFHLHAEGTEYEVTLVVTAERKGPESSWDVVPGHDHMTLTPAIITAGPPPADLTAYLDETIPAHDQEAFYLGDDMQLRFNRSYGPEMYTVSGYDLRVEVLDSQRMPVPLSFEWTFSEEPALAPHQELLLEALLSAPCVSADINAVRKKLVLVVRPVLKPRSYYYLVLRSSAFVDKNLYEAPFATSRYHSFDEQYLELEHNCVSELLPRVPDDAVLLDTVTSLPVPTREEENVLFEHLWGDALGLPFRERAERGEMVVLHRPVDAAPVPFAILIDSPEPLLVPGRTQLDVAAPNGVATLVVRSLDGSRALIFVHNGTQPIDLPVGDYQFTTTYRREAEGLPTQRVNGNSTPSTVSVVLSVSADAGISVEAL